MEPSSLYGLVGGVLATLLGGLFGLPWLNRRNAKTQVYDQLAQKWLDRYEARVKSLETDRDTVRAEQEELRRELEGERRVVSRLRADLEDERIYVSILVGELRRSGIPIPERPRRLSYDVAEPNTGATP